MRSGQFRRRVSLLIVFALFGLATAQVGASTCSLADHIRSANTNTSIGGCPPGTSHDIITITEDITLSEALPAITGTITIEGNGHRIDGEFRHRIFDVSGGRLTIIDLTLALGFAEDGGAMRLRNGAVVSLTNAVFDTNVATNGGAISVDSANVNLMVNGGSFVKNIAEENGGAMRLRHGANVTLTNAVFAKNRATHGGAISMADNNVSLTVIGSNFDQNKASEHGGAIHAFRGTAAISNSSFVLNRGSAAGGAIYARNRKVTVANSTFAENQSDGGGGAFDLFQGELTLTHLTFAGNRSGLSSGNAIHSINGTVYLRNSIFAGGSQCAGRLHQSVGNLSQDGSCLARPIGDALLGELTDSPAYYPLLDYSPAVDAADPQFCLETDQIGTPRPQGGGCDVGAIESATARPAGDLLIPPPPCPLFDQIVAANTDAPSGGCEAGEGHDIIKLAEDITLDALLPPITSEITIEGNGHTISGASRFRIFSVDGGALTINNLTLTKGRVATNGAGGAIAVQNAGQLTINNSRFINNLASTGGAIHVHYPNGRLTINESRFVGNRGNTPAAPL